MKCLFPITVDMDSQDTIPSTSNMSFNTSQDPPRKRLLRGFKVTHLNINSPLARRKAPAEGRRPEGEGANIDRRLVPYHGKCRRIQSRIEFIYLYIYIYI